jgi:ABC-type nitrate/sulfonate/bicarbonate transport system substrate-binding protein
MSRDATLSENRRPETIEDGLLYYTRCPVPTATGLAVGLNTLALALREEHGLRLLALQDVDDESLRRRHFDHGIVNLIREGGNIPAIWAFSSGARTRLVGITWLDEYQAIVTTPDSPVDGVGDLAGRRIALPSSPGPIVDVLRASALGGFVRGLRTVGLGLDSVQSVDAPRPSLSGPANDGRGEHFEAELDLLAEGTVDAVWLKGAGGLAAVQARGLREVFRFDLESDPLVRVNNGTPRTLTVREELVHSHPDVLRTYLRVLHSAPAAIGADRERLWTVLSHETHQSVEHAETAYRQVTDDSLLPSLDPSRLAGLQDQADFLHAHGFIPNAVDVSAWALDVREADIGEPRRPTRVAALTSGV